MAKISEKIAALPPDARYFSLEFFPPKTQAGTENLIPRLTRLAQLRPLFVTVTWGAGGSTATRSLELAELCQKTGLTTCLHLTCTNMRQSVLDHALGEAKRMGIRNILALRGDEPRPGEYGENGFFTNGHAENEENGTEQVKFTYAVDLVRYIRQKHGDYFCLGVAGYPEGHATSAWPEHQSVDSDLPYLIEKTQAGAEFIMTQLFYDVDAYTSFERRLRAHESGAFKNIPIIPGLMPIQSWGSIRRVTKLCSARIPQPTLDKLERVKADDELVKQIGLDTLCGMIKAITQDRNAHSASAKHPEGFHLYTLNLEKVVAQILERSNLLPRVTPPTETNGEETSDAVEDGPPLSTTNGILDGQRLTKHRRRLSSANSQPRNRVIIARPSSSGKPHSTLEAFEDEAGVPKEKTDTRDNALAIAEGEGSLGRAATWDDFPNGRWGDARSPAYGSIDGYGPNLHVSHKTAVQLWGYPETPEDITALFKKHLRGELNAIPWSEEALSAETELIREPLLKMNERGWWTVASQPAVNCVRSDDPVVGWGPKRGGFVWQKPFVEFFLPSTSFRTLCAHLDRHPTTSLTYYATTASSSSFTSNAPAALNPVTWGAFKGREITTPTIIEAESFRAWADEAFGIWREWAGVYAPGSKSAALLRRQAEDVWLVCVVGHEFAEGGQLWDVLLGA